MAIIELRHLRYFIAVAEEGNLKLVAQKRLHTAQSTLSRQIHDLELVDDLKFRVAKSGSG